MQKIDVLRSHLEICSKFASEFYVAGKGSRLLILHRSVMDCVFEKGLEILCLNGSRFLRQQIDRLCKQLKYDFVGIVEASPDADNR